jgi:hypothetical protein
MHTAEQAHTRPRFYMRFARVKKETKTNKNASLGATAASAGRGVRLAVGDAYLTANKKTFVFIYSPTEKAGI